ncbi:hypothetical protein AU476_03605 [Cupriavidus sp. UYMSc13B]|nr:hypothetical protein AU476_03605 [Cupriavidus sp. UYMSc13B]
MKLAVEALCERELRGVVEPLIAKDQDGMTCHRVLKHLQCFDIVNFPKIDAFDLRDKEGVQWADLQRAACRAPRMSVVHVVSVLLAPRYSRGLLSPPRALANLAMLEPLSL